MVISRNNLYFHPTCNRRRNVLFVFKVNVPAGVLPQAKCVFWRPGESAIWQTSGCRLVPSESDIDITTCECDHLTIFASLMDPFGAPVSEFLTHCRWNHNLYVGSRLELRARGGGARESRFGLITGAFSQLHLLCVRRLVPRRKKRKNSPCAC